MEYIVAGYNMLTDITYSDGRKLCDCPGGSFYSASGVKFWRDSLSYVGTAGKDYDKWYGDWFRANNIDCKVDICLPYTLKYTLEYAENGIWSERCLYGEDYEVMAKDVGRITVDMFRKVVDKNTKGIYIEASLSAKIADNFSELKGLIPNGCLMWEINGDDLRDKALKPEIDRRIGEVDAFSMNLDEAHAFFNTEDDAEIIRMLSEYNKPCFLRLGEKGAGIVRGETAVFGPSIGTEGSVDPTGCGNCSTAVSMIGLAEGISDEKNIAMANLAASYCAKQFGPYPLVDEKLRAKAEKELGDYLDAAKFSYGSF